MAGRLILCASPIGNLGDAPPRLAEALSEAQIVYAEDTRRARVLLDHLGAATDVRSFFVGNEHERVSEIEVRLEAGETVALLTDAGTPSVSDPGLVAVRAAVAVGAEVTGVPGPSAVTFALSVSGAPADRFVFEGFLPRKGTARSERIGAIASEERTVVFFAAPSRLGADLTDLAARVGDRSCVVCRELTKVHEEVWRGSVADAAAEWSDRRVRGEVTVVVFGGEASEPDLESAIAAARAAIAAGERPSSAAARAAIAAGERPSSAVKRVAVETGVSRGDLYEAVIEP